MTTPIKKAIHLNLLFMLLFFSACNKQASENEIQSFEWEIESLEKSGIDEKVLSALVDNIKDSTLYGVDALILVKNRKIVFEEYLWWIADYNYKNKIVKGFEASGNGGNKIIVIPELDVVIILTGSAYGSEYVEGEQAEKIIEDFVLASIR